MKINKLNKAVIIGLISICLASCDNNRNLDITVGDWSTDGAYLYIYNASSQMPGFIYSPNEYATPISYSISGTAIDQCKINTISQNSNAFIVKGLNGITHVSQNNIGHPDYIALFIDCLGISPGTYKFDISASTTVDGYSYTGSTSTTFVSQ